MKGWKYEGYRHSLAAKGIKTSLLSKKIDYDNLSYDDLILKKNHSEKDKYDFEEYDEYGRPSLSIEEDVGQEKFIAQQKLAEDLGLTDFNDIGGMYVNGSIGNNINRHINDIREWDNISFSDGDIDELLENVTPEPLIKDIIRKSEHDKEKSKIYMRRYRDKIK